MGCEGKRRVLLEFGLIDLGEDTYIYEATEVAGGRK